MPGAQPLAFDRYAYAANNPLRFADLSGHRTCTAQQARAGDETCTPDYKALIKTQFGITLSNGDEDNKAWDLINARLMYNSLIIIDAALNGQLKSLVGGAIFKIGEYDPYSDPNCPKHNCTYSGLTSGTTVTVYTMGDDAIRQMNIYHEFGHVLDNSPGMVDAFSGALGKLDEPGFIQGSNGENPRFLDPSALIAGSVSDPYHGTAEALQHPSTDPREQWADIFANYLAGNIDLSKPTGPGTAMYNFVTGALLPYIGLP